MRPRLRSALLFRYAQFLTFFGLQARAMEFIQVALEADPGHQRAWTFAGFLNAQHGRFDAAVRDFERAVALKPDDTDSQFNLGFALQHLGRHEQAIESFGRVLAVRPLMDRAWYGSGLSLLKLGRWEEAAAKLAEAVRLQPMNPYAGYHLAAAWLRLGRRDKVRAEYERVRQFDPKVAEQMAREFGAGS